MGSWQDYLGNEYLTVDDLCYTYGIDVDLFYYRKSLGYSLEQILTMPQSDTPVYLDYRDIKYSTLDSMCKIYGIKKQVFMNRVDRGYRLEDALHGAVYGGKRKCKDHLGNEYDSLLDMCYAHNVSIRTFKKRMFDREDIEYALTGKKSSDVSSYNALGTVEEHKKKDKPKVKKVKKEEEQVKKEEYPKVKTVKKMTEQDYINAGYIKDHFNRYWPNEEQMCEAYLVDYSQYRGKRLSGCSVSKSLYCGNGVPVPRVDHFDRWYDSPEEMCKKYKTTVWQLIANFKKFDTFREALIGIQDSKCPKGTPCEDHLGNKYPSKAAMCRAWGISAGAFDDKLANGYLLKDILELGLDCKKAPQRKNNVTDHLGTVYSSTKEMCERWKVNVDAFRRMTSTGYTLEQALTSGKNKCFDHLGNLFKSKASMCEHYNISVNTFYARMRYGWSLQKALTTPVINDAYKLMKKYHGKKCVDHLGKEFDSITDMCSFYNIGCSVYRSRLKRGWTLEDALTVPVRTPKVKKKDVKKEVEEQVQLDIVNGVIIPDIFEDPFGNIVSSIEEMCSLHGVKVSTYKSRIKRGMNMAEALLYGKE